MTMQELYKEIVEEKRKMDRKTQNKIQSKQLPVIRPKGGRPSILCKQSTFLVRNLSEQALNTYFSQHTDHM